MTNEIKLYIEENIQLIEDEQYEEFLKDAPDGTGGILYNVGIDWLAYVNHIPASSFYDCKELRTIHIPINIIEINDNAFRKCSNLNKIIISKNVKYFGSCIFKECDSLEKVIVEEGLEEIPSGMFQECSNLNPFLLPQSIKYINPYAFYNCHSLTSFTIPKNVELINSYAFGSCFELETIIYEGTKKEWFKIRTTQFSFNDTPLSTVKCTDGDLTGDELDYLGRLK